MVQRGKVPRKTRNGLMDDHAQNILASDGAVDPAIGGVHAVVAEEEELIFAAGDELFLDFTTGVGWDAAVGQVRFVKLSAINVNRAVFQENGVATHTDDAF